VQALVAAQPERLAGRGPDGAQPLHFARSVELAHWLVAQGADPLARDTVHANTPARWAAADSRRPEVAEYLLRFDPETELFLACAQGDAARAARVLDAAPELVNALGTPRDLLCSGTPLHCAIERGDEALADLLLARGADPGARSAWGHYPLHSAVMRGRLACVELLLAHGARPAVRDRCRGLTPREWALRYRRDDLADLLAAAEQA
jgi:ankyrin repeat protein